MQVRKGPRARVSSLATAVAVATVLVLALSSAALAGPIWRLDPDANTTAAPGETVQYFVQVTNVGDAPTDGSEFDIVAHFPAGLTGFSAGGSGFSCTAGDGVSPVFGATDVKCKRSGTVAVFQQRQPSITAAVDAGASGVLTTSFELSGGGAATVDTVDPTLITPTPPDFGIDSFDGQVASDAAGDPFTQAGGHPYAASTEIDFNTITNPNPLIGALWPVEPTKDVLVDLPPGLVGNPTGAATCTASQLANSHGIQSQPLCPPDSQVGTALVRFNGFGAANVNGPIPVFNIVPPPNVPARFGFNALGTVVTLDAALRSGSDYGLSVNVNNVSEGLPIQGTSLTFWGVPADPSHNPDRACPGQLAPWQHGPTCQSGAAQTAFLRNPTSCVAPSGSPVADGLVTSVYIDSWANPGRRTAEGAADLSDPSWEAGSFVSHLPPSYPAAAQDRGTHQLPTGCEKVPFEPKLAGTPATPARAGTPSGFAFDLTLPQNDDPGAVGEADLKKAVVTLPAGVRISPSSADGLGACGPAAIALHSIGDPTCPDSSKIGSIAIKTPLLDDPLSGSIYLAAPHDNPFGSLLAIYLVAKGPGLIVKLPGEVSADAATGQLTATFDDNPQLPFSSLHLEFKGGPRAPLVLPKECGTYTTHAVLTSWSGKTVTSDSSFTLSQDAQGAGCTPAGFAPGFSAGTQSPAAGRSSPFLLNLTRRDADQELGSLTVDMPTGLLGRISRTVPCPDGAANAGGCVDLSKIGTVTVGAGAGASPFYITNGRAYITGPYKGAPYGLSIVVPAVAGPFDLGNVVVRAAIFVDRTTAALKVVSDPLPTILQGIPLDVRDVRVAIDKPDFIVNPTSCAAKQVRGTIVSTAGAVAQVSSRFQAADCASLPLAPKLTLTVGAPRHTSAGVSTPLSTTLTQTPGQTNLRSVSVALPGTLNALLPVVRRACKLAEFEAGHCTSRARVGSAVAVTPLLRDPLRGPAYFVKNPARVLPDLMVALRGQVSLDLTGKVFIPGGKRLATHFDTIPDAAITKFTLRLVSGRNGPVGIVTNLCSAKARAATAAVGFRGQNGRVLELRPHLRVAGCPHARRGR